MVSTPRFEFWGTGQLPPGNLPPISWVRVRIRIRVKVGVAVRLTFVCDRMCVTESKCPGGQVSWNSEQLV